MYEKWDKYMKLLNNVISMPSAIAGRLTLYSNVSLRSRVSVTAVLCDLPSHLPLDVVKTFCIPGLAPRKKLTVAFDNPSFALVGRSGKKCH